MTRLILGLLLVVGIGCTSIRPVGPLAGMGGGPGAKGKDGKDKDDSEPVTIPTPKPTPPMNLVDPGDVSSDPYGSQQKLMSELEGDRKTISTAPTTVEVSRYKNGVKQN